MKKAIILVILFSSLTFIARASEIVASGGDESSEALVTALTDARPGYTNLSILDAPPLALVPGLPGILPGGRGILVPSAALLLAGSDVSGDFCLGSVTRLSVGYPLPFLGRDRHVLTAGVSYSYLNLIRNSGNFNINEFSLDLMSVGKGWNAIVRVGIPFSSNYTILGTKTDVQDSVNPVNFTMGFGRGWSIGQRLSINLNLEFRFTNLFKKASTGNKDSMGFTFGPTIAYRI